MCGVSFRTVAAAAGLEASEWTPRELRHSFVSLLSSSGVPIEDIAHLVGHASTNVTEKVYRKELRPVLSRGATAMDACSVAVELVGQTSSLTGKAYDIGSSASVDAVAKARLTRGDAGGRYWVRTSDLFRVREARSRCANRPRWRRDLNPCTRICSPLPRLSATPP